MPEPLKPRNRARLREKDAARLRAAVEAHFGVAPWPEGAHVDRANTHEGDVLLLGGHIIGFFQPAEPEARLVPTVRVLLAGSPGKSFVTVDMGAVPFVHKGADIMGPGIVEADPNLQVGDLLWVRDERNRRPLAVGEALVPGAEMPKQPGKKVRNLHRVGDLFWTWEG